MKKVTVNFSSFVIKNENSYTGNAKRAPNSPMNWVFDFFKLKVGNSKAWKGNFKPVAVAARGEAKFHDME